MDRDLTFVLIKYPSRRGGGAPRYTRAFGRRSLPGGRFHLTDPVEKPLFRTDADPLPKAHVLGEARAPPPPFNADIFYNWPVVL